MFLLLATTAALANGRPAATDRWVLVDDTALLCARPDGQGQCARFRAPGADPVAGAGPRVFRLVHETDGEVLVQAQLSRSHGQCGVLPTRVTPLLLRVYVPDSAVTEVPAGAGCLVDPAALPPDEGRDWELVEDRVAVVDAGAVVSWLDGAQAGELRRDLWLWPEHAPAAAGGRVCATFDLGPDDGGPVGRRAFDLCFPSTAVHWDP